jgi:hypothetical protein
VYLSALTIIQNHWAHGGHWPFAGLNEIDLRWGKSEGIIHAGQCKISHMVIPNDAQSWGTSQRAKAGKFY